MADTKITALAAITTVDPAADVLPIVDVSDTSMAASGTTKKITSNQILGAGGTATLASATITGDLTVRTNKLAVTSTGVGAGTASPTNLFTIGTGTYSVAAASGTASMYATVAQGLVVLSDAVTFASRTGGDKLLLDSSGNVGVGVTPSAWHSTYKAFQIGAGGSVAYTTDTTGYSFLLNNAYYDGTNWLRLIGTAGTPVAATAYSQNQGQHQWLYAGTGTAASTITWTTGMTLDASGNLLVGKTALSDTTVGWYVRPNGITTATMSSSVNTDTSYQLYSTGASAYRFYVGMGGTVYATNTTISAISDARLKENVQDIDVGLDAILALKPRKFDWKTGKGKNIKGDRGFIAQEFETVFPNLIDEWKDPAPEGEAPYKSVRQDLIPVLVKAIQELTARVEALEA